MQGMLGPNDMRGGERAVTFPLNDGQRQAAHTLEGPVLVSAGAGTGKTRALTERFVHAVSPNTIAGWESASVDEILTITFTNKAAGELMERVRTSLRCGGLMHEARDLDGAWISTIHGFCSRLLRRHALEAGVDPAFSVADETDARGLREEAFEAAAQQMHRSSEEVQHLFGLWGFEEVWGAVDSITRELETRGWGVEVIDIPHARDVSALVEEALATFRQAAVELAPHVHDLKSAASHARACGEAIELLAPLRQVSGVGEREAAEELWRALAGYSASRGSAGAIKDTCAQLKKTRLRLLSDAVAVLTADPARALVDLVSAYRSTLIRLKAERGLLDFADLQLHTVRILEGRTDLRERYRRAFKLVMVDEFQDTDELQMRIVETIAGANLCTVGDERQSIYRFRGADLDVYRRHRQDMTEAGAHPVELVENYRSHPELIAFVNRVFGSPELFGRELLHLDACRGEPATPLVPAAMPRIAVDLVHSGEAKAAQRRRLEAGVLAERFSELREAGVDPSDMVVLVRRHANGHPIAAALRAAGFAVLVLGGGRFLDLPEIAMMRALTRVVANPRDDRALVELLLSPMSLVSEDGVWLLRNAEGARETGRHLVDALVAGEELLEPDDAIAAQALYGAIRRARQRVGEMPLGEVLMRAVEETGTDLLLLARGDEGLEALTNVLRFARKADAFEHSGGVGAAAFVARINAEERFKRQESLAAVTEDGSPAVRVMTIHAAKGLEFPVVAVPMLGEQLPPSSGMVRTLAHDGRLETSLALPAAWGGKTEGRRTKRFEELSEIDAQKQAEEAQRLLYVACTRAREVLLLSGSGDLGKELEKAGTSDLTLLRRALGPVLDAGPGTEETRMIEGTVPVSLRIHAAPGDTENGAASQDERDDGGQDATAQEVVQPTAPASGDPATVESGPAAEGVSPTRPEQLSYSNISVFEACPLRYWAQKVARLGEAVTDSARDPLRFGSAMHALLQLGEEASGAVFEERAAAIARYHGLYAEEHARLLRAVSRFKTSEIAAELDACAIVRREHPFSVTVTAASGSFELTGAIDAYGRTGEGALVVDYKSGTSAIPTEGLHARYETQARCYGYAALRDGATRTRVVFVRPEVERATGMEQVVYEFARGDLPQIERFFADAYERIAGSRYLPRDTWDDAACHGCRISGSLCPLTPKRRGAG